MEKELKYEENAIHIKDDIISSLEAKIRTEAEKIVTEEKRNKITEKDMQKAIVLILLEVGSKLIELYTKE